MQSQNLPRSSWGSLCLGPCLLIIVCLLFSLAGCAPGPAVVEPPFEPPARFSMAGTVDRSDQWWQSFRDPALDRLIERALEDNPDILQAWYRLDQASALARRAGAGLIPQLDATGAGSSTWTIEDHATERSEHYQLGLSAGYEIDLWGRIRANRDAAQFEAAASREDLQTTVLALTSQLTQVWFRLNEQRGQHSLLAEQRDLNEQNLELVGFRFRAGKTRIADVLQQRQLIEANRGEQAQVESRIALLEHQLAVLLGVPAGQLAVPATEGLSTLPPLPETGLPSELLRRRPDVRSALYRVQAADRRVAQAIADRFPQIRLTADFNSSAGRVGDLFDRWLANLAANLVGPLVDGGQRRSEVDRSRAAAGEALQNYRQVMLKALQEVEDALVQERRQSEYLQSLQEQLALADQVVERVKASYVKGVDDYLRVLTALQSKQQLERTYLTAKLTLFETRIALYKALAGGVPLMPPDRLAARAERLDN